MEILPRIQDPKWKEICYQWFAYGIHTFLGYNFDTREFQKYLEIVLLGQANLSESLGSLAMRFLETFWNWSVGKEEFIFGEKFVPSLDVRVIRYDWTVRMVSFPSGMCCWRVSPSLDYCTSQGCVRALEPRDEHGFFDHPAWLVVSVMITSNFVTVPIAFSQFTFSALDNRQSD